MALMRGSLADRSVVLVCAISVLAVASVVHGANTGSLAGIVRDTDGLPVPGVTVQIFSEALIGGPQVAVSGLDGRFAFHLLPVGSYTAEASLAGFQTAIGDVRVMSNRVGSIAFIMVPESFTGVVEVTATAPVVDTTQVNAGMVLDEDYLELATIGSGNRFYQSVLSQAAGVTGGSNPSVYGSTWGENSYLIDDMNTTDPSFGTWSSLMPMDAIQELNFQTGGFEAEFGQATGGIVNLVTKSGGNQFSGSFDGRYRNQNMTESGKYYDPDRQQSFLQQYSASLGGPILRDRLWFFSSLQYRDESYEDTFAHFPGKWEGLQFLGKLTWQASAGSRLIFKYTTEPADIPGINSSRFVRESAKATQEQGSSFWHLEFNSVLSADWLLVAQAGTHDLFTRGFPTDNPDTISGHANDDTGFAYNSVGSTWDLPRFRDEYRVNATWFTEGFAGAHELKAGVEYSRVREEDLWYLNGGAFVWDHNPPTIGWDPIDLNGDGYFNYYLVRLEPEARVKDPRRSTADLATFYLQDAWRPVPNLTIKPGIRLDNVKPTNHAGEQVADMRRWQPRLGLAWDITGRADHVLRGSAGRFMDPTSLFIPWFASGVEGVEVHEYNTLEYYCNTSYGVWCDEESLPDHWPDPIHWTNWDGQEYVLIDNRDADRPVTATTVDQEGLGRLRAPYADQLILAYEVQVAADASVELSRVYKRSEDLIEDTCRGNEWAYGAAPYPNLDDPSTWTTASDCGSWLIVNMPGFERRYDAWILRAESRQRWGHLMASYTYADSRGTNHSGPAGYAWGTGDYFPVNFYNIDGKLWDHRDHRLKLNGYFLLPRNWNIGVDGFYSSPGHQSLYSSCSDFLDSDYTLSWRDQRDALGIDRATMAYCEDPHLDYGIHHEPRGSLSMKSIWQLDLQFSKLWHLGNVDLTAILSVFNVFGHEFDMWFNSRMFRQATSENPETGEIVDLYYCNENTRPSGDACGPDHPNYHELYGDDRSPILIPIGQPMGYWDPRRYEIGLRIEF